ncbi:MAG: response regulator [Schwartzia sp.]|nr:response regulator [Schwartzia sp. (in: firmicutes)]
MASYQSKTVLVVDDDDMNLKMAELILKKELGTNVILVDSGMKCIDTLQHEIVDLVLLDIQMPVVNGIKTLEMIRRREDLKNIPVIFLTASSDKETVIKAGRMGVDGYIKKPFLPKDLAERVKRILDAPPKGEGMKEAMDILDDPAFSEFLK